jgi:hypothetical protein
MNFPSSRPWWTIGTNASARIPSATIRSRSAASAGSESTSDEDGLRIHGVRSPGRVTGRERAVGVREAAPRGEPHHALAVREQHGGAREAECGRQRGERLVQRLVDRARAADRVGEAVQHLEVDEARAKVLLRGLLLRDTRGFVDRHSVNPPLVRRCQESAAVARKRKWPRSGAPLGGTGARLVPTRAGTGRA